jgi:hypothetical protein
MNLIFLLMNMVFFFVVFTQPVLADCVCQTKTTGGNKSCSLVPGRDNCRGKTATCLINPDGGCNHNMFQGASCVCLAPGDPVPQLDEGTGFCVQQGLGPETDNPSVSTALGCVPVKVEKFIPWLLEFVFGIAGGIAFLLMIYGFILISTTGGDPKKMQGAQETVSSAITGLVVCIFAVFLLRLIAVDILRIPGIN